MKYFERDFPRWSYDLRPPHFVTDPSADDFLDGCGGCRTTAANELPRHGSADEDDLPQTAEDTCTALGECQESSERNLHLGGRAGTQTWRDSICASVCRWPPPDTRSHEDGRASRPLARRMLGACATPRRGESTSVSPRCTRAGDALGVRIDSGLALDTRSQVNGRASRPLARRMLGGRMRDARAESTHERVAPLHPRWRSIGKQQVSIPVFLVLLPPDPNSE